MDGHRGGESQDRMILKLPRARGNAKFQQLMKECEARAGSAPAGVMVQRADAESGAVLDRAVSGGARRGGDPHGDLRLRATQGSRRHESHQLFQPEPSAQSIGVGHRQ